MRVATLVLTSVTVVSLELIVLIIATVPDPDSIRRVFHGLIAIFDASLVLSSVLLGVSFLKRRARAWAAVFFLNLVIVAVAGMLRAGGVLPPRWVFALVDIYWLNLYLIALSWNRLVLRSPDA